MEGVGPQMWLELRRVKMLTRSLRYQLENYHCFNIIEGNLELFHIIIFRCSREWPGVSSPQSIPHRRSSSSLLLIISFQEYVVLHRKLVLMTRKKDLCQILRTVSSPLLFRRNMGTDLFQVERGTTGKSTSI